MRKDLILLAFTQVAY